MMRGKALFISSRPIFPIVGGDQIRTAQQLTFLSQRYDVDVVYQSVDTNDVLIKDFIPSVGKVTKFKVSKKKCWLQTLRFLFNRLPLQVNYYYNIAMRRYIDSCVEKYDLVFCNNIRTAEYVRNNKNVFKVIDFVDAISMNYDKARHQSKGIKRLLYQIDHRRCGNYEQCVLRDFDRCAVISDVDKQYILEWGKKYL